MKMLENTVHSLWAISSNLTALTRISIRQNFLLSRVVTCHAISCSISSPRCPRGTSNSTSVKWNSLSSSPPAKACFSSWVPYSSYEWYHSARIYSSWKCGHDRASYFPHSLNLTHYETHAESISKICWTSFVISIPTTKALVQFFLTSWSPGLHAYLSPNHHPHSCHWDHFSMWLRIFQQLCILYRIGGTFSIKVYKVFMTWPLPTSSVSPVTILSFGILSSCDSELFIITFTYFHSCLHWYMLFPLHLESPPPLVCLGNSYLSFKAQLNSLRCSVQAELVTPSFLCPWFVFHSSVIIPTNLYDTVFITSLSFPLEPGLHEGRPSVWLFSAF